MPSRTLFRQLAYLGVFDECFVARDDGRYEIAADKGRVTEMDWIETAFFKQEVLRFAGKNGILDEALLAAMDDDVDACVFYCLGLTIDCALSVVTEGDNLERTAPFSLVLERLVHACALRGIALTVVIVKSQSANGYSKAFYENWRACFEAAQPHASVAPLQVYFGIAPGTDADNMKATLTFEAASHTFFLGSDHPEYRFRANGDKTTGYAQFLAHRATHDETLVAPHLTLFCAHEEADTKRVRS